MRAPLQEGDFPFPVKYGYCAVGVVEHGPGDLAGRTVAIVDIDVFDDPVQRFLSLIQATADLPQFGAVVEVE